MSESQENRPRCIVEGCTLPIDIILVSSDNKEYATHRENLGAFSGGFPTRDMTMNTTQESIERANLDERGAVLQLLLPFMHHTPNLPDLNKAGFGDVVDLAEAAKKWHVYSAMTLCDMYMLTTAKINKLAKPAMAILLYSVKHRRFDIANCAAPKTLSMPMEEVVAKAYKSGLGDALLVQWMRYRQLMLQNVFELFKLEPYMRSHNSSSYGGDSICNMWSPLVRCINSRLLEYPQEALCFSRFLHVNYLSYDAERYYKEVDGDDPDAAYVSCENCRSKCAEWVKEVEGSPDIHEYVFSNLPKIEDM